MYSDDQGYNYDYDYEMEDAGRQPSRRLLWIVGGSVGAILLLCACCILVLGAFFAGREVGSRTEAQPTVATEQAPEPTTTPTTGQAPEPVVVQPLEGTVGQEVMFDGSGSRPGSSAMASYEWDFGDGNKGSGAVVTHIYNAAGTYQVTLTVTGEDGLSTSGGANQIIIKEAEAPAPGLPVIESFSVTPTEIAAGACVDIAWSVGGDAAVVELWRDEMPLVGQGPLVGQQQDCVNEAGSYSYHLEAFNSAGERVGQEVMVTVTPGEAQNPLIDTEWELSAMNVNQVPLPNTVLTVYFGDDGTLTGNAGCNEYSASYRVVGNTLSVGPATTSGATCGAEIDQQEQAYLGFLQLAAIFELSGDQLIIRDATGQEVLRYSRTG